MEQQQVQEAEGETQRRGVGVWGGVAAALSTSSSPHNMDLKLWSMSRSSSSRSPTRLQAWLVQDGRGVGGEGGWGATRHADSESVCGSSANTHSAHNVAVEETSELAR